MTEHTYHVGDKVEVIGADYTRGKYANGDILTVENVGSDNNKVMLYVDEFSSPFLWAYEVRPYVEPAPEPAPDGTP